MTSQPPSERPIEAEVEALYRHRFPARLLERRNSVWRVICRHWLGSYVPEGGRVLEVAAGFCEFINNIEARERAAIDLNPDTADFAEDGVEVHRIPAETMASALEGSRFDMIFMSNFLEHCRTREQVLDVLAACRALLSDEGRVLILGPNYRFCSATYWDYFDHHLALTERSVSEAVHLAGLEVEECHPRTLPFSFHSRLPSHPALVRAYLAFPPAWRVLGKQFLVVARGRS